jgi:hypothetical protein
MSYSILLRDIISTKIRQNAWDTYKFNINRTIKEYNTQQNRKLKNIGIYYDTIPQNKNAKNDKLVNKILYKL